MTGLDGPRVAEVKRHTRETRVECTVNLDGTGVSSIRSGVPFLDHMLDQIARHAGIDLTLSCEGDLEIDTHHSVEDCALVFGRTFRDALGDRTGIARMFDATVPMDEALAQAVVDCSGRPFASVSTGDAGGVGLPPSLMAHFFESFVAEARITLHLRVIAGGDSHHMAEACFKAFARALAGAVARDPRRSGVVASTKGTLTA
ncbi:MAG: hypothetical protein RL022_1226 [Chloroflexota bacterium]